MKRIFKYDEKDSYTKAELNAILEQHETFLGVEKLNQTIDDLTKELSPVRVKARTEKLTSLLPKDANKELFNDIIALSGIQDEDTDEVITTKLQNTVSKRDYLKAQVEDTEVLKPKTLKKVEKEETEKPVHLSRV